MMMHSTTISEAFIGEPLNLDLDPVVFQLWLQGHDVESVTERQQIVAQSQWVMDEVPESEAGHLQRERLKQFVREDIEHQYRVLGMLRRYLKKPHRMLQGHFPYQISPWQQSALIEGYYRFDVELVRNVLGRNLTDTHSRKECESLATRAGISVDDCVRQMCNLKRVYNAHEVPELLTDYFPPPAPGEDLVVYFYRRHFGFSHDLAARYSRIVFLSRYRFETLKTRLMLCSYADFDFFAQQLLTHWGLAPQLPDSLERPPVIYHISSSSVSGFPVSMTTITPPTTPHLLPIPSTFRQQSGLSPIPMEVKPVKSLPGFEGGLLDTAFLVELKELKGFEKDKKSMEEYITAVANSLDLVVPAKPDTGRSRTPSAFLRGTARTRATSPSVASNEPSTPTNAPVTRRSRRSAQGPASPPLTIDSSPPPTTVPPSSSPSAFSSTSTTTSNSFPTPLMIMVPTGTNAAPVTLPLTPRMVKLRTSSDKLSNEKLLSSDSAGSLQNLSKNRLAPSSAPTKASTAALAPSPAISLPPSVLRRETVRLTQTSKAKAKYTRDLIKSLTNIAVGLEKGKNLRNFFVDLAETAVRPLTKLALTGAEVERFFEILQELMPPKMLQREDLCALWRRFLAGVAPIFLVLYCRVADPGAPALSRYPQEEPTTENRPSIEVTATDLARETGEDFEEEATP